MRDLVHVLDPRPQVVGVENGVFTDLSKSVGPERADVGIAAEQDADRRREASHTTDRQGAVEVEIEAVGVFRHEGYWQERGQVLANRDRSGTGTAPAVRTGEGLVDIVMLQIGAEVARPREAED